jgi:hypothetical protein
LEKKLVFACLSVALVCSAVLLHYSREPEQKRISELGRLDDGKLVSITGSAIVSSYSSKSYKLCQGTCVKIVPKTLPENRSSITVIGTVSYTKSGVEVREE